MSVNISHARHSVSTDETTHIASRTLDAYSQRALDFWEGTRDHDVSQNIQTLLSHLTEPAPHVILDLGCGPGRDLRTFRDLGHHAIGLDGSARFVVMARAHSGCEVWEQDFLKLSLPRGYFDGVFANASLFHVPQSELARVLGELHETLKPQGVLFSSNPRGENEAGWNGGRYGVFHDLQAWRRYLLQAGFVELTHYYRPPGLPFEQQRWLASAWRKA